MKKYVLIIEDEEALLQVIIKKLHLYKISTVSCTTGKQALGYLATLHSLPAVIWLDYYLPDMNGIEFMQELSKNAKWNTIPVVVVSNSASSEKVRKMKELGVKEYILKADHELSDIILHTINKYL